MKLIDYIEDIGQKKFADLIGVHPGQVSRYVYLQEIPRPSMARKIKELTHGLVDYADIYDPFFDHKEKNPDQLEMDV